ncbi:MAG TPA: MBL fold metallo-hydrolase [Rhodanobacteraceae bacterium]|nr:MBL fold metallo-hydrolase [Rhodanobacteraceae bacterium]
MAVPGVQAFFDAATSSFSYVVWDGGSGRAAVIDPVLDFDASAARTASVGADRIVAFVRERGLALDWVLETHVHADHLSAAQHIKSSLGGRTGIGGHVTAVQKTFGALFNAGPGFARDGSQFDHLFADDEAFLVGDIEALALATPGHTPACVSYLIGDALFVGDTLFMPDYGSARCDFPGGDARTLYRSVQKLYALPESTRMFLCHDYKAPGRDAYVSETTVGAQRAGNLHIRAGVSEADFVALRESRDATLSAPRLLLPSVQVNMRAGRLPAVEDNGVAYLKLPLNQV